MTSKLALRIVWDCVLIASVLFLPWYIVLGVGIVGLVYFRNYIEFVIASLLLESLYGASGVERLGIPFFHFIVSVVLFALVELIRDYVLIGKK